MDSIEVSNLKVSYDGKKYVVDDLSFSVREGEIFGFLGPNGAGKTTTIRVLTTLIKPTHGTVKVLGMDVVKKGMDIRKRIGVILQQPSYEWNLTVENNMLVYGTLWNIPRREVKKKIDELISKFELEDIRKTNAADISIGQRRRLQLVRELMHDAELLFLDEPTIGLDPIARKNILTYFKSLARNGITIFFTTHNLEEADFLCDRVGIINHGKLFAVDSIDNLKASYEGERTIEVMVNRNPRILAGKLKQKLDHISVEEPVTDDRPLKIITRKVPETMEIINDFIKEEASSLLWLNVKQTELEDVFFKVVGENRNE
ncbi:MAG: ABC transporter ATP-binding protein [Candidatus Thermoplasmatota archaeon]|jgi:ABC-2 type transport system ATP-binding protein|nr:ABC transporter ATP-binding protein [Candidatus Thermoplasmatota archaeon]MCL5790020.1 ABC transporter ATP-binding protein [Candidatus Thermoplasmatota archaeon]